MGFSQAPFRAAKTVQPGTFAWMLQNAKDMGGKIKPTFLEKLGYSAQVNPKTTVAVEGTSLLGSSVAGGLSEKASPGDNFSRLLSEIAGGTLGPSLYMGFIPALQTGIKNFSKQMSASGREDIVGKQLKKIIDDCSEFNQKLKLLRICGTGDATMNKQLKEMLTYAGKRDVAEKFEMITNGILLNEELISVISKSLTRIIISIEGLNDEEYFYRIFKKIWKANGGEFSGNLDTTYIQDSNWKVLYRHNSRPLSEIIRDVNKYSLNLMARNTMLTILAEDSDLLILESSVNKYVNSWFEKKSLPHNGMILQNGAGLSRKSILTSEQLLLLMEKIYHNPLMPEMLSSFPISGVDGTLKRRMNYSTFRKSAHFKTGSMRNVNAIAGFLLDKNKEMKIFIFIMNDLTAKDSHRLQEALITQAFK